MKKINVIIPLFLGAVIASCNSNKSGTSTTNDSSQNQMSSSKDGSTTPHLNNDDEEFIKKALGGGMMEVELGKIAQTNASDKQVKEFGEMMVTDHSKAGDELKSLAASKKVQLPDDPLKEHKEHIDELKAKKGAEFDKAYLKMMLEDHKKDVKEFEEAAKDSKDADVKAFAEKTLPVLEKHLSSAKTINKTVKASLDSDDY